MNFDIGTVIAIAAVLLFYLRLILLQRQKGKSASFYPPQSIKKSKKQKSYVTPSQTQQTGLVIANWLLVGAGVGLILSGVALNLIAALPPTLRSAWWLPVSLGVLLMGLGIR